MHLFLKKNDTYYPQISYMNAYISYKYVKIDVSEGIDTNKTSASKECMLCRYWYFKDVGFKFDPHVWNEDKDVL